MKETFKYAIERERDETTERKRKKEYPKKVKGLKSLDVGFCSTNVHCCISCYVSIFSYSIFHCMKKKFLSFWWTLFVYFYFLKYLCVSCLCVCVFFLPLSMHIVRIFSVRFSFIFSVFPVFDLVFAVVACFFVFIHSIRVDFVRCALCVYSQATRLHSFRACIYLIHSNRLSYMLFILNLKSKCTANGRKKRLDFHQYINKRCRILSEFLVYGSRARLLFFDFTLILSMSCYLLLTVHARGWFFFFNCTFIVTTQLLLFSSRFFHIFFFS